MLNVFKHLSDFWFPLCVPETLAYGQNVTKSKKQTQWPSPNLVFSNSVFRYSYKCQESMYFL